MAILQNKSRAANNGGELGQPPNTNAGPVPVGNITYLALAVTLENL